MSCEQRRPLVYEVWNIISSAHSFCDEAVKKYLKLDDNTFAVKVNYKDNEGIEKTHIFKYTTAVHGYGREDMLFQPGYRVIVEITRMKPVVVIDEVGNIILARRYCGELE